MYEACHLFYLKSYTLHSLNRLRQFHAFPRTHEAGDEKVMATTPDIGIMGLRVPSLK